MTDPKPRRLLIRDGVAARSLQGMVAADSYSDTTPMTVRVGASALRATADDGAEQNDQLLFGERFDVLLVKGDWTLGQARRDGYVGWLRAADLRPGSVVPTHRVEALGTVALSDPDARATMRMALPLNALVRVGPVAGRFAMVEGAGWIPQAHLAPIGRFETDPAAVAERHLGAPYLWGGRGAAGIDCSGLVQQALFACGMACPRDSDQQAGLGTSIAAGELRRGDLVCWPGHIGVMADGERLIHASGVQMAVVIEPLTEAMAVRRETGLQPNAWRRIAP